MQQDFRTVSIYDHYEWARAELASAEAIVTYYRNKGSAPPGWAEERREAARASYEQHRDDVDGDMRNAGQIRVFGNPTSQI